MRPKRGSNLLVQTCWFKLVGLNLLAQTCVQLMEHIDRQTHGIHERMEYVQCIYLCLHRRTHGNFDIRVLWLDWHMESAGSKVWTAGVLWIDWHHTNNGWEVMWSAILFLHIIHLFTTRVSIHTIDGTMRGDTRLETKFISAYWVDLTLPKH